MAERPTTAQLCQARERGRVRVVFYVDTSGMGGAEKNLALLIQSIDLSRFEPHLVLTRRRGVDLALSNFFQFGLKYEVIDAASTSTLFRQFWNSFRFFRRIHPDVVHFNRTWRYGFVLPQIAARMAGVKTIILMENLPYTLSKQRGRHLGGLLPGVGLWRKRRVLSYRLSFVFSDWVISPGRAAGEVLVQDYKCPRAKLVVIPYGVKTDLAVEDSVRRQRRGELGFADQDLVIGAAGRFEEQKGFLYLLAAFETVASQYPSARLCIIGDGGLRPQFEDFVVAHRLTPRVALPGWRSDVPNWLPCFDIFVFPSLFEGLPIGLLEALAAGLPIVASRIPPVEEMITDGKQGILVPPAAPGPLAEAINRLARDPEARLRLSRQARSLALEKYTLEGMLAGHMQLYGSKSHDGRRET